MLPVLACETEADRSVGYRNRATVDTWNGSDPALETLAKVITADEEEANALDQKALEHLDRYAAQPVGTGLYDAANTRRLAQEKRKLVADLKKRAGLS